MHHKTCEKSESKQENTYPSSVTHGKCQIRSQAGSREDTWFKFQIQASANQQSGVQVCPCGASGCHPLTSQFKELLELLLLFPLYWGNWELTWMTTKCRSMNLELTASVEGNWRDTWICRFSSFTSAVKSSQDVLRPTKGPACGWTITRPGFGNNSNHLFHR